MDESYNVFCPNIGYKHSSRRNPDIQQDLTSTRFQDKFSFTGYIQHCNLRYGRVFRANNSSVCDKKVQSAVLPSPTSKKSDLGGCILRFVLPSFSWRSRLLFGDQFQNGLAAGTGEGVRKT